MNLVFIKTIKILITQIQSSLKLYLENSINNCNIFVVFFKFVCKTVSNIVNLDA